VTAFTPWLEGTALATWVRESPSIWAYPTILTLHTVGLGIVVGASAVVDFRLLGYAPRIRVGALAPLFQMIAWAFVLNAATGVLLFIADATTKSTQPVFYVKLGLIFVALWCTFTTRRIVRRAADDGSDVVPSHGPRLAAFSLLLWAGAITAGRLMAYLVTQG
jgi:hypothetical protein